MKIEKFATGMWYVFADNGQRLGTIAGGKGIYGAEVGIRHLGYFGTLNLAGEAICKDAGKVDIVKQMEEIIETTGVLKHYKSDFDIDKEIAVNFGCSVDMIWVVRPSGTHLVPVGLPRSKEELMAIHECYAFEPHHEFLCFYIDAKNMTLKPLKFAALADQAKKPPQWTMEGGMIRHLDVPKARIEVLTGTKFGTFGEPVQGGIALHCTYLPTPGDRAVLIAMAHHYAVKTTQSLFAKLADVRLVYDDKLLFSTAKDYENAQRAAQKKAAAGKSKTEQSTALVE